MTVERVRAGACRSVPAGSGGTSVARLSAGELLDYARRQGLTAGPVFCTRNGKG